MLKIKDDLDLKELEKFGFKENQKEQEWAVNFYEHAWEKVGVLYSRHIYLETEGKYYGAIIEDEGAELLFDLIQAGLVEKVEK